MFIKISQLIAIGLLLLVGCSAEPSNKNESDSKNTGVVESDISGCWVRTFFSDQDQSSFYQKITYKLELGGSYTGEWFQEIITTLTGTSSSGSNTLSGNWIIDDGYVVIQESDGDKLTLKAISKHELIQVGSDYPAFTRC